MVPQLKQLLRVVGSELGHQSGAPGSGSGTVDNVKILGVGFRDSAYTYLDEWGIPSGGDWALHRGGALFVEGAEGLTVDKSEFTMLDGNVRRPFHLLPALASFLSHPSVLCHLLLA